MRKSRKRMGEDCVMIRKRMRGKECGEERMNVEN